MVIDGSGSGSSGEGNVGGVVLVDESDVALVYMGGAGNVGNKDDGGSMALTHFEGLIMMPLICITHLA